MSCRADVRKAIVKDITDRFVKGRNTYELTQEDVISIVSTGSNLDSKAKKASQARVIANNLADRIAKYTDKHVMGWVHRFSEYDPYTITLKVSDSYVESVYRKLPEDRQNDPQDVPKSGEVIKPDDLPAITNEC